MVSVAEPVLVASVADVAVTILVASVADVAVTITVGEFGTLEGAV